MTGRERLLAIVNGEVPDRVPFAPNIGQWFSAHKQMGTLPPELAGCTDEIDAMLRLEIDIFSRRCGNFSRMVTDSDLKIIRQPLREVEPDGPEGTKTTVQTPVGELVSVTVFQPESHTSYEREHFWKDFYRDWPAIRYWQEHSAWHFDVARSEAVDKRVGDAGLVIACAQQTPLKQIINLAGPQNALLWCFDEEPEIQAFSALHTEKCIAFAREFAASNAFGMMSMDNLDVKFFSPDLFERFCKDHYQKIGEVLHEAGKFWCAHACGGVARLRDQIAEVRLDGLEGSPHAPLGDIDLAEFRDTIPYDRHLVWGGLTCHEMEAGQGARNRIRAHVDKLFKQMRPFHRFIFSSACNTCIKTPFENILYAKEACWEMGRN